jgi:AraC family transcriptional regulator, regulatory protein of adaptative response / methylated-DNA-[protein]-cysteine methyltransferase
LINLVEDIDLKDKTIQYSLHETKWGTTLVGSVERAICAIHFGFEKGMLLHLLNVDWPKEQKTEQTMPEHQLAVNFINNDSHLDISILLAGTEFQRKVWKALLHIEKGKRKTYLDISKSLGNPKYSRAVGAAVGANKIAYLIPCHRVVYKNGEWGNFRWGNILKTKLLEAESNMITLF